MASSPLSPRATAAEAERFKLFLQILDSSHGVGLKSHLKGLKSIKRSFTGINNINMNILMLITSALAPSEAPVVSSVGCFISTSISALYPLLPFPFPPNR